MRALSRRAAGEGCRRRSVHGLDVPDLAGGCDGLGSQPDPVRRYQSGRIIQLMTIPA